MLRQRWLNPLFAVTFLSRLFGCARLDRLLPTMHLVILVIGLGAVGHDETL